jgi:mRNA interferase MazF
LAFGLPLTAKARPYPSRVRTTFDGKESQIVVDQIRTVDKQRLVRRLGVLAHDEQTALLDVLARFFGR